MRTPEDIAKEVSEIAVRAYIRGYCTCDLRKRAALLRPDRKLGETP